MTPHGVRLPVRTALLQNEYVIGRRSLYVRLPVRTALLQNKAPRPYAHQPVRLPVRTALLQNWMPWMAIWMCAITSQNGTAPKLKRIRKSSRCVRLPVRTALLQNKVFNLYTRQQVRLPVRTALLQNNQTPYLRNGKCDYQSERHCSKTVGTNSLTAKGRPL